jgi:hypothetical protein
MLLTLGAMSSSAAAQTRAGTFSCTATAAIVLGTPYAVANPADSPCVNDSQSLLGPAVLNTTLGVIHAATAIHEGTLPANHDYAFATSTVAGVRTTLIPGHTIQLGAVNSTAQAGCGFKPYPNLVLQLGPSSSNVASLNIDGTDYVVGSSPLTIPVDGVADVLLNQTYPTSNSVTQIAAEIDLLGSPVLIAGYSQADASGNPCGTI